MKNNPNIFVIVVTYKGKRWYDECFNSLRKSTLPVKVVVVDNSPGNEDVEYIEKHFPEVHIIKQKENLGFGKANNIGMKYALEQNCDYVFLLNQDAWLDPDALEKMVVASEKHPEFGVVAPVFTDKQRNIFSTTLTTMRLRNAEIILADIILKNELKDIYINDYSIQAAGWLIPYNTMITIGGFTPLIYHYGEDDDYMHRLKYHKLPIGVVPNAIMVHDHIDRLENSQMLFVKSNVDVPEDYLDININKNANGFLKQYLYLLVKKILICDFKTAKLYWHRFNYIRVHAKEIDYYRSQNKIKQPNWIQ